MSINLKQMVADGLLSPTSFWAPDWTTGNWSEHAPFLFWLVDALRPKSILHLAAQSNSFSPAFCVAIERLALNCRYYSTQTDGLERFAFASPVKSAPAKTIPHFPNASIDLLQLDGSNLETREDFKPWQQKLSEQAVVLIHQINPGSSTAVACALWRELASEFPHFEFTHGAGTGLLGVGPRQTELLTRLFAAGRSEEQTRSIRIVYHRLGTLYSEPQSSQSGGSAHVQRIETELESARKALEQAQIEKACESERMTDLEKEHHQTEKRAFELERKLRETEARLVAEHSEIEYKDSRIDLLNQKIGEFGALLASTQMEIEQRELLISALQMQLAEQEKRSVQVDEQESVQARFCEKRIKELAEQLAQLEVRSADTEVAAARKIGGLQERIRELEAVHTQLQAEAFRFRQLAADLSRKNNEILTARSIAETSARMKTTSLRSNPRGA